MPKKKYLVTILSSSIVILIIIGIIIGGNKQNTFQNKTSLQSLQPGNLLNSGYVVENTSDSPKSSQEVMQGEIIRETLPNNSSYQSFVVKSDVDGSIRQVMAVNENDVKFENMQPQNWSPTDRFAYVYVDYPDRRDIIFLKTDGRFTNAQFYLHATGIYPDMNVISAKWLDEATLELQTNDIKTRKSLSYIVDFDDDTGYLTQCSGGPSTCNTIDD
jgi:hypothetical protein